MAPALGALAGVRPVGALAAVVSAAAFARLAVAHWGRAGHPAAALFAVATVADLMIGRIAYALGVAVGLAALLALRQGRSLAAAALAVVCSATSPVAGLFLALAGVAVALTATMRRPALGVAAAALGTAGALATLFPQGSAQPIGPWSPIAVITASATIAVAAAPRDRALRVGAGLYALAGVLAFALPTPIGSNVSRLGAAFGLPLLAGIIAARGTASLSRPAIVGATIALAGWQWWAPLRELGKSADPSFSARYYAPLLAYLDRAAPRSLRVEVPFTRAHMEAVEVAADRPLARGWQTQMDRERNRLFFDPSAVTAASYERWLRANAVSYVALPDAPIDPAGRAEAALVRRRPAYLESVWRDAHWQVFRVRGAAPLVSGPARLTSLGTDGFTLRARAPGRAVVHVRFTPYWTGACVRRAPGGWTEVALDGPGTVRVQARFSLTRGLLGGGRCEAPR